MTVDSRASIRYAVDQVYSHISWIEPRGRISEREEELWRELCCCILSSQVSYELAQAAAEAIEEAGILPGSGTSWEMVAEAVCSVLSGTFDVDGRSYRYRFPNSKSSQIAHTWMAIRSHWTTLGELLSEFDDARLLREWMVNNAPGLGPKQSSMFLRNAGRTLELAVLDRHVLAYMEIEGLLQGGRSRGLTFRGYEKTESILRQHADSLGYRLGVLDFAIWIVMRVATGRRLGRERVT